MLGDFRSPVSGSPLLNLIAEVTDVGYLVFDETLIVEVQRLTGRTIALRVVLQDCTGVSNQNTFLERILHWNFAQAAQSIETIYLDANTKKLYAEWRLSDQQLYQRSTEWRLERFLNHCEMLCNLLSPHTAIL